MVSRENDNDVVILIKPSLYNPLDLECGLNKFLSFIYVWNFIISSNENFDWDKLFVNET